MVVELAFLAAALTDRNNLSNSSDLKMWMAMWVAGMAMLVADLWALSWTAMWVSLTAKNPVRATGNVLAKLLVLPWVAFIVIVVVVGNLNVVRSWPEAMGEILVGFWFALGLMADMYFGLRARTQLQTTFREVATQRAAGGRPIFARLFGRGRAVAPSGPPVAAS